jgi:hypothetical protein
LDAERKPARFRWPRSNPLGKHQGFQSRIDGSGGEEGRGGERKVWRGAKGYAQRGGKSAASHPLVCFLIPGRWIESENSIFLIEIFLFGGVITTERRNVEDVY